MNELPRVRHEMRAGQILDLDLLSVRFSLVNGPGPGACRSTRLVRPSALRRTGEVNGAVPRAVPEPPEREVTVSSLRLEEQLPWTAARWVNQLNAALNASQLARRLTECGPLQLPQLLHPFNQEP